MDELGKRKFWLGVYLILVAVIIGYLILSFWPTKVEGGKNEWTRCIVILGTTYTCDPEVRLIFLAMLAGAMGSFVHAATSFVTYVGNRSLSGSWMWWYVMRPFIGMGLAMIFYVVVRGGLILLTSVPNVQDLSPFGVAAFAALSGMFSKQAADKLRDLFDNLFKTEKGKGDEERTDKLEPRLCSNGVNYKTKVPPAIVK
jgi:hypothetical protein